MLDFFKRGLFLGLDFLDLSLNGHLLYWLDRLLDSLLDGLLNYSHLRSLSNDWLWDYLLNRLNNFHGLQRLFGKFDRLFNDRL